MLKIRILGRSESPTVEWRGNVFGTGNNITLKGDMARRSLKANLDAQVERPELRTFEFNPITRVMQDRGKYVAAALILVRAYICAGSPAVCGQLGSYNGWNAFVRAPLMWVNGGADPVASMDAARAADPERQAVNEFIDWCIEHIDLIQGHFTAQQVRDLALLKTEAELATHGQEWKYAYPDLFEIISGACNARGEFIEVRTLGRWLRRIEGRVHSGHVVRIARQDGVHGVRYIFRKV